MHDNDHSWKYHPETRTLSITLPRVAWLTLAAILEQPESADSIEDLVAGLLQLPIEGFARPASWQRGWLMSYFGRERIEAAQRAFEKACRDFEEATK